jgi:hypothetical protein
MRVRRQPRLTLDDHFRAVATGTPVLDLIAHDPEIARIDGLVIYCTLLEDLAAEGPFGPIFLRHDDPSGYVDWLGDPEPARLSAARSGHAGEALSR